MSKYNEKEEKNPEEISPKSVLEELLREGARKMLQAAIENEVEEYIVKDRFKRDERGHRLAVRNGSLPEREILTGLGEIRVKQPRVDDRKLRDEEPFSSKILPRYLRRIPSIDNLVPALYLRGISTGDFPQALSAILGERAKGLSATNIVRLKARWEEEYKEWSKRDLSEKTYVYFWVDGVYFNVRLDDDKVCVLVIMAADEEGKKELLAVSDGYRESKLSWKELLLSLKRRGLSKGPRLCIGDGNLGFWAAVREVFPSSKEQRCWVHSVPRRAQTNEVKCSHAGKTSEPASLGQMVVARAAIMKHVRHAWPVPIQGQRANRQAVAKANVQVASSCISDDLMGESDKGVPSLLCTGEGRRIIGKGSETGLSTPRRNSGGMLRMFVQ